MRHFASYIMVCLLGVLPATAQQKLQSDMGDQNAQLLNKNETQIEAAGIANRFDDKSVSTFVGSVFLRYGLAKKFELRALVQEGHNRDKFMQETMQSFNPMSLGAKISVIKDKKYLPDVALSGYVNIPVTAHTKEQSVHWSPALFMILEKELNNKRWVFLANTGFQQNSFNTDIVWQALGRIKFEGFDHNDITLEYAENYQTGEYPAHCLDIGYAHDFGDNFEVNACVGGTIFTDDANQFVSIGLSMRMP